MELTRKIRSNSTLNALTPSQKEMLLEWLFEDNLAYKDIQQRVKAQFDLECSRFCLMDFRKRQAAIRTAHRLTESFKAAEVISRTKGRVEELRDCSIKVVAERLLDAVVSQGDTKELATLGRLLLESQHRENQDEKLALARERFEFRASKAVLKVAALERQLSGVNEAEKIDAIARALFGAPTEPDAKS